MKYIAPSWLPGGDLQTIWPALVSARSLAQTQPTAYRRVRWTTPDDDFVDVDFAHDSEWTPQDAQKKSPKRQKRPLLVLFHGLEGSSSSHYALAFAEVTRQYGWAYAVPHFRGCSGGFSLFAAGLGCQRQRHWARFQPLGLYPHVLKHHETQGAGLFGTQSGSV